ncbi:MAG TPA: 4'-phosphopantetheinyl transferase superfamily protein [Pyrinomonadaceae bacterium]
MKKDHTQRRDGRPAHAWASPPTDVRASDDVVDLWRLPLGWPPRDAEQFRQTLSADEAERAARFHFARDRDRFTAARALLRAVLALYLRTEPARLRFTYGPHGKPALAGDAAGGDAAAALRFNLAHSHELALVAVARAREVGVDVEHVRPDFATAEVAERFFSRREAEALRALPEGRERVEAFYRCWTRKEAYIKAKGEGLSFPLSSFTVSLAPGEPAALLGCDTDAGETERWTLVDLEPGADYFAAAAVEGRGWRARTFEAGMNLFERL